MAFLDNSGDILLDAVLTDAGRYRLARGDGSFRVVKFACGDDEIAYTAFNPNHPSGSAYFDVNILQTPVLEAFTNASSMMNSKLISIPRTNLLYLPTIKLNELPNESTRHSSGVFVVACDEISEDDLLTPTDKRGIMKGARPGGSAGGSGGGSIIRIDQGLDTTQISPSFTLDSDLIETQYIVEVDNRFAQVCDTNGNVARVSFIDDDNIASYYLSLGTDAAFISENTNRDIAQGTETVAGPRGTILKLKLKVSLDLHTSNFFFSQLGPGTISINGFTSHYIDSTLRITGATTGRMLNIPLRFAKVY